MTFDADIFEQFRVFLPAYLNADQAKILYSELSKFPENLDYYLVGSGLDDVMLQGDGWRGFVVRNFSSGDPKSVAGVVISNSCDVSTKNERALPVNVMFAPLISLDAFRKRLLTVKDALGAESTIRDVVRQRITNIFYLPRFSDVLPDSLIMLDDIHVHPLSDFLTTEHSAIFKLRQHAWYLLLIKLSIHFTRSGEAVPRF